MASLNNRPVIVGIGEITERPKNIKEARDPMALMAEALRFAQQDAGVAMLAGLESLAVINCASWSYPDLPAQLSEAVGMTPKHRVLAPTGGETPTQYLHRAAMAISRKEITSAAIVGGEAQYSIRQAGKASIALPWPEKTKAEPDYKAVAAALEPQALRLGLFLPSLVYPFYEAASGHAWGQSPKQAIVETGEIWARYSKAAEENPYSWSPKGRTPENITTPSPENRLIGWPYTRSQVANPQVNQAAAVLLMSYGAAKAAGVSKDKMIFIGDGAGANAPRNYMLRGDYHSCPAQDIVLETLGRDQSFNAFELYSCFPIVPKMARRTLDLAEDFQPSVTGGLSFFGAPLNNYMTHSTCAMVRALRRKGGAGLLYGQGEFMTKHHGVVLQSEPSEAAPHYHDQNSAAESREGNVPPFDAKALGAASLETFTIKYGRDNLAEMGIVVAMTDSGSRTLARIDIEESEAISRLTDMTQYPIGSAGTLTEHADGVPRWRFKS